MKTRSVKNIQRKGKGQNQARGLGNSIKNLYNSFSPWLHKVEKSCMFVWYWLVSIEGNLEVFGGPNCNFGIKIGNYSVLLIVPKPDICGSGLLLMMCCRIKSGPSNSSHLLFIISFSFLKFDKYQFFPSLFVYV